MYFFLTEVTHDGPTIVDHRPCVPVGRSAPLGLSLVWLCSLRPWRGAADYSHRAAPHWPTLKGPHRPPPAGAPSGCPHRHPEEERVCFRRKMAHSLKGTYEGASCMAYLGDCPAHSLWCWAWRSPRRPGRPCRTPGSPRRPSWQPGLMDVNATTPWGDHVHAMSLPCPHHWPRA